MQDNDEMTMLFAFPDQTESFVHGYEAGALGCLMAAGEALIDRGFEQGFPLHTANVDLINRMANAYGYSVEQRPTEYGEWTAFRLTKATSPKTKLSLVMGAKTNG